MRKNGTPRGLVFVVRQIKFLGCSLYNSRYFSVVNVRDVRENVMFNLMIQSSCKPIDDSIFSGEIDSSSELMYRPGIFNGTRF